MSAVRKALELHLAAMVGGIDTAFENVTFRPVDGVPYQAAMLMLADPNNSMAGAGWIEQGIFQVSLKYPDGTGPGAAGAQAALVRSHFKKMTTLTNSGVNVVVTATPAIAPGMPIDGRYTVPVSIPFQAQINHP